MLIFNGIFLLELLAYFAFFGFLQAFTNHFRVFPETICQIINIYLFISFVPNTEDVANYNFLSRYFNLIIFIRALKVLTLMYEITSLRRIIETMKNLIGPITHMASVLCIIYYIFALLGMLMFGGLVKKNLDYPIV